MGLGMNIRKPACIFVTLAEGYRNDLAHTHDGVMSLSSTLWKQLNINSAVYELSAIWGFMHSSWRNKNALSRGSFCL